MSDHDVVFHHGARSGRAEEPALPHLLYRAEAVRSAERGAVQKLGIDLYELMSRAGEAIYEELERRYPHARHVLICCGGGNNGGDGYTVARLLKQTQRVVTVWRTGDPAQLIGDAARARGEWISAGGEDSLASVHIPPEVDLIVDALLGIGARGAPRSPLSTLITALNAHPAPIFSIDLPSGLDPDTGSTPGVAVVAEHTLTLVGIKRGLVTGLARAHVGRLSLASLGVEIELEAEPDANLVQRDPRPLGISLPRRSAVVHKGRCGRVAIVGGAVGMGGALCLASEAASRAGAGLVTAVTAPEHLAPLMVRRPEVMTQSVDSPHTRLTTPRLKWASGFVIGPGLGLDDWGEARWAEVLNAQADQLRPWVIDADALTLLAEQARRDQLPAWWSASETPHAVLTPHPGEAARLLDCSNAEIERDRFAAARALSSRYGAVIALKGAGTIVDDGRTSWVCGLGNPGMASGGMGDVLSGVIGGLLVQGLKPLQACLLGVWLHSRAADLAHRRHDDRGLLAADLFATLAEAFRELGS